MHILFATKGHQMHLFFIRHAQSINNAHWGKPGFRESPDPVLTETGVQQAKVLAEHLDENQHIHEHEEWDPANVHGYGITHLYASLMERAVRTASYTGDRLGVPFEAWDIHESGGIFGRDGVHGREDASQLVGLPGKPRSFFETNFPTFRLSHSLDETGWWNRAFETGEECQVRAERIWQDLLTRHGDREGQPEHRVAFVSHGGFFMHLMCAILDLPWRQASHGLKSWFLLSNCSISHIEVRREEVIVCYLNRTDHLPGRLVTG